MSEEKINGVQKKKLTWTERLGWGLAAGISTDVPWALLGYYLMYFYTDVVGIAAATAGTIMLVARCFDAFTDLVMGYLCDTNHFKWGKYRSIIKVGVVAATILLIGVFINPPFGYMGKVAWQWFFYGTYGAIGMTCLFIPLSCQAPNMTSDPEERSLLAGIRSISANAGTLLVVVGFLPLVALIGGGNESLGFAGATILIALFIVVLLVWDLKVTKKYELNPDGTYPSHLEQNTYENVFKQLGSLKYNRPAVVTICGVLLLNVMMVIRSGYLTYVFQYYFKIPEFESIALLFLLALAAVGGFLFKFIVKWFDDDANLAFIVVMIISAVLNFVFYFMTKGMSYSDAAASMQYGLLFWLFCLMGLFQGIHYAFPFLIMQNAVEYGTYKAHKRQPGIIFCFQGFAQTIGGAIGGQALGILLESTGYVAKSTTQSDSTLSWMLFGAFALPAILTVGQAVFQMFYGMNGKQFKEIAASNQENGI